MKTARRPFLLGTALCRLAVAALLLGPLAVQKPALAQDAAGQNTAAQNTAAQTTSTQNAAPAQQAAATPAAPLAYVSPSYFSADEAAGKLPPVAQRLPEHPAIATMDAPGRQGGEIHMLVATSKDTKILVAYSYARLIGYDRNYNLVPDILEAFEAVDNKVFTFHLRKGMKWSDGEPFTTDDFRYYWEDVANNPDLNPGGLPTELMVNGKPPKVEVIDPVTIRYTWDEPNAEFLPALARAAPLFIFRPAHYLKKYHIKYAKKDKLDALVKKSGQRNWASLHNKKDNQYKNDNPDLPTLDPWMLRVKPPAQRFVFTRNPYYYRVDAQGHQLPYLDQVVFTVADDKLIPAKTASGESDLQARSLSFDDYTILKDGEDSGKYHVRLWDDGRGSTLALFPNLTTTDPVWRQMMRDIRFRHALSLAIDRHEINQAIYFGLGHEVANTVLERSPMFSPEIQKMWSTHDVAQANALLDQMGLTQRNEDGVRLLPDGRPAEIIVDTADSGTEQTDILELIAESWKEIGISLFIKPSQLEVFRNRIFAGDSVMSVATGVDNAIPTPDMSPAEFAPSKQDQYMWAKWGQYIETGGKSGEKIDLPAARQLADWLEDWRMSPDPNTRLDLWFKILHIWAEQTFTIGIIANVPQPVIVSDHLHNVPEKAVFAWDPGAQFGIYKPDTFWLDEDRPLSPVPAAE
ncbi:MAG TPA: ABC transporter substrate-binding protein [Terriglobales bacterium]|nr:ABC transporter substrate-binding protein [Terriglobales bacterium]